MTTPTTQAADGLGIPDFLKQYANHPLADKIPSMSAEEYVILSDDIQQHGLLEPITIHEGMILDGRHRYKACKAVGYKFKPTDFIALPAGIDPFDYVVAKAVARRHMTAEQKRDLIKALLKKHPEASSRVIARLARVSDHTVEAVRQATAQSAQLTSPAPERVGADGKSRRKPRSKSSGPSAKARMKQLAKFKEQWESFNEHQKRDFIRTFKDEIAEMLEYIEATVDEGEAETEALAAEGTA
jgi:ParB-like chromosome segregation protein Spo0J